MNRVVSLGGLAAAMFSGCLSAGQGAPAGPDLEVDTRPEIQGRQLYDEHCQRCHPGGEAGRAPAINVKPFTAEFIRALARRGHGDMPAITVGQMNEAELDALVEYLFTLRSTN